MDPTPRLADCIQADELLVVEGTTSPVVTAEQQGLNSLADPRVGRIIAERYMLLDCLARGGMGTVYRALELAGRNRYVAVKMLNLGWSPQIAERFLREAEQARKLKSPHTVTILDSGRTGERGDLFLAMELIPGRPLSSVLAGEERLRPALVRRVLIQLCDALAEVHARGLVHRDLKPDNILVDARDTTVHCTLIDFGVVKVLGEARPLTHVGMAIGTPAYMSPEQAEGRRNIGPASDVYAIGVMAFELLTGRLPFEAASQFVLLQKHLTEPPPRLTAIMGNSVTYAQFEGIVDRCLAKPPDQRFASAIELGDALKGIMVEGKTIPPP